MKDINRYLQNENKTNFNAKQQELGFKALFCRYIIEEWTDKIKNKSRMKKINKVIVKECVKFYYKCLTQRNKIHNDLVK